MDKYQEALNEIKELDFPNEYYAHRYIEDMYKYEIDTLQELIDNNATRQEYCKDCKHCMLWWKDEYVYRLEKALDKVCKILEEIEKDNCVYCPFEEKFCVDEEERLKGSGHCRANKWKEWSLEESEKQ